MPARDNSNNDDDDDNNNNNNNDNNNNERISTAPFHVNRDKYKHSKHMHIRH